MAFARGAVGTKGTPFLRSPLGYIPFLGRVLGRQGGPQPCPQCCVTLGKFLDLSELCHHLYNQVNDASKGDWEEATPGARKKPGIKLLLLLYLSFQQPEIWENNHKGPLPCPHYLGLLSLRQVTAHSEHLCCPRHRPPGAHLTHDPGSATCALPPAAEVAVPEVGPCPRSLRCQPR